jgi:hypothetical protein
MTDYERRRVRTAELTGGLARALWVLTGGEPATYVAALWDAARHLDQAARDYGYEYCDVPDDDCDEPHYR